MRSAIPKEQNFDCPVCHWTSYVRLPFTLPDGSQRQGSFFRCTQCSFGFTDPPMFRKRKQRRAEDRFAKRG